MSFIYETEKNHKEVNEYRKLAPREADDEKVLLGFSFLPFWREAELRGEDMDDAPSYILHKQNFETMRAKSEEIGYHLRSISMLFAFRRNQFTCVCALR